MPKSCYDNEDCFNAKIICLPGICENGDSPEVETPWSYYNDHTWIHMGVKLACSKKSFIIKYFFRW